MICRSSVGVIWLSLKTGMFSGPLSIAAYICLSMRTRGRLLLGLVAAATVVLIGAATIVFYARDTGPVPRSLPLKAVGSVAMPGDTSRFDYASLDPARHIAHLGASELIEVDTATNHVVRVVDHLDGFTGCLLFPRCIGSSPPPPTRTK